MTSIEFSVYIPLLIISLTIVSNTALWYPKAGVIDLSTVVTCDPNQNSFSIQCWRLQFSAVHRSVQSSSEINSV